MLEAPHRNCSVLDSIHQFIISCLLMYKQPDQFPAYLFPPEDIGEERERNVLSKLSLNRAPLTPSQDCEGNVQQNRRSVLKAVLESSSSEKASTS